MGNPYATFAKALINANRDKIPDTPRNRELMNAIMNDDQTKGEELANNLCNSYGKTQEEAVNMAGNFFASPMQQFFGNGQGR